MPKIHGVAVDFLNDKKLLTFYDDDGRAVTFVAASILRELVEKWEFRWKNSDQDYTWDCIQEAKKLLKREG